MSESVKEMLINIGVAILVVFILSFIFRKLLSFFINKNSVEVGADPTAFIFLKNSISFLLFVVGLTWVFYHIPYFKNIGSTIFAGAGILAAVIGFASQKAFSNIVGGIFILIFKPFKVGELINVSGRSGMVEEITLRHVLIRDFEARRIIIPNSSISDDTIINSSIKDEHIRKHYEITISYDSNTELAKDILNAEAMKHPNTLDRRTDVEKADGAPIVPVKVVALEDSAVRLRAWVWTATAGDAFELTCSLNESVKKAFEANGIKIPFPQVEITQR